MQPTLRQMPPNVPPSTMAIWRFASRRPGMVFADPLPMMHRSKCCTCSSCQAIAIASGCERTGRRDLAGRHFSRLHGDDSALPLGAESPRPSALAGGAVRAVAPRALPEVVLSFGLVEVFDGVAKGGARHPRCVFVKKVTQGRAIDSLASLAQRPADGLLNKVVLVEQEQLGDPEEVFGLCGTQEVLGADHGNPPLPDERRPREVVQGRAISSLQVAADDRTATNVDQIPVVDVSRVVEIVALYERLNAVRIAAISGARHERYGRKYPGLRGPI